jgi:hypothetical protein
MNAMPTLEQRVALLEREVEEMRRQLPRHESTCEWLQRVSGSFKDDPEFEEIVRLGREFREADRPKDDEAEES